MKLNPLPTLAAAGVVTKTPNAAIQMIANFFGGKLDAFFGFAKKQQHGFRGATPSRASVREERAAVSKMKLKPFVRKPAKPLSARDEHRLEVKYDHRIPGKFVYIDHDAYALAGT